ncbi:MAG: hypothetical protein ACLQVI_34280 [Polyangiaceae bacterium]
MARVARLTAVAIAIAIAASGGRATAEEPADATSARATGTPDDARRLVDERSDAGYARRAEITRALVALDDRAVAALVVAKRSKSAATRGWAADTLESMGRERADEQIRTSSDETLVGIFAAYGEARDPDALGVLSSFIGSDRTPLREAARAALAAYGGDAISKLRQDYAELVGQPAPSAWTADETARELFAASDRIRLRDVYAMLDDGLERARKGDLAGAVERLDATLARQGDLGRADDIASVYVAYGVSLEDSDPATARAYLERAARLAPGLQRAQIAAELDLLEGRALEARGLADVAPYRRALELDPGNAKARAALDRIEARAASRRTTARRWAVAAAALLVLLMACILFLGRGATRSPPGQTGT